MWLVAQHTVTHVHIPVQQCQRQFLREKDVGRTGDEDSGEEERLLQMTTLILFNAGLVEEEVEAQGRG